MATCLVAGLAFVALGRYHPDLRDRGFASVDPSERAYAGPVLEVVGGFLAALGGVGLVVLQYTTNPALGIALGLVSGAIVGVTTFVQRDEVWAERSVDDTIGAARPTSGFIGREARVAATIEAGQFGEITFRDDDGQVYGLAATADVDIAVGSAVTITGTKGLDLVVAPRGR